MLYVEFNLIRIGVGTTEKVATPGGRSSDRPLVQGLLKVERMSHKFPLTYVCMQVREAGDWAADFPVKLVHGGLDLFEAEEISSISQITVQCVSASPESSIGGNTSREKSPLCGTRAPVDWVRPDPLPPGSNGPLRPPPM